MKDDVKRVSAKASIHWPDGFRQGGIPKPTYGNLLVAMEHVDISIEFDLFRNRMMIGEGELSDHVVGMLRHLIYERFGFHPSEAITRDVMTVIGRQNMVNPVDDWLVSLKWDRKPRVERLFATYLGADDTTLNRAFGVKMMCAMVRRARKPGAKFDHVVILEGEQDIGKSRFCRDLAGRDEYFNDTAILTRDTKAQMEAVEGKWVFEIAELHGMNKTETEKLKAFISRTHDRERKAYAHFRTEVPRTCIFIGTTNAEYYLSDVTGNRRFWPVQVKWYDHEAFARDRAQILAEAVVLEKTEKLWLDDEETRELAAQVQASRLEPNPYTDRLSELKGEQFGKVERIHSDMVWRFLGLSSVAQEHQARRVVADAMRQNGWRRTEKPFRMNGKTARGYSRAATRATSK